MTKTEYTTVSLSKEVYALLEERARRNKRSAPKEIEWMIEMVNKK